MYEDLLAVDRLQLISAHDALVLLKTSLAGPKLQCCDHPFLRQFDDLLHLALTKPCNIALTDDQWTQASLPVWSGGSKCVPACIVGFLASAAGTSLPLKSHILRNTMAVVEDISTSLKYWLSVSGMSDEASVPVGISRELWTPLL